MGIGEPSRGARPSCGSGGRGGRQGATAGAAQAATVLNASPARRGANGTAKRKKTRVAMNGSTRESDTQGGDH